MRLHFQQPGLATTCLFLSLHPTHVYSCALYKYVFDYILQHLSSIKAVSTMKRLHHDDRPPEGHQVDMNMEQNITLVGIWNWSNITLVGVWYIVSVTAHSDCITNPAHTASARNQRLQHRAQEAEGPTRSWLPSHLLLLVVVCMALVSGPQSSNAQALAPGVDTLRLEKREGVNFLVHLLTGEAVQVGDCALRFAPDGAGVLQHLPANGAEEAPVAWAQSKLKLAVTMAGEGHENMRIVKHRRTDKEESTPLQAWWREHAMRKVQCSQGTRAFPPFDAAFFPNSISGACHWCTYKG